MLAVAIFSINLTVLCPSAPVLAAKRDNNAK